MPYSLLYVSRSLLAADEADAAIAAIVTCSRTRNVSLDVTGALVSAGGYFAQLLEGPQEGVKTLMRSIEEDPRHMRVKAIRIVEEPRRFPHWAMLYGGNASFATRHIAPFYAPLPPNNVAHLAQRLVQLLQELASLQPG